MYIVSFIDRVVLVTPSMDRENWPLRDDRQAVALFKFVSRY